MRTTILLLFCSVLQLTAAQQQLGFAGDSIPSGVDSYAPGDDPANKCGYPCILAGMFTNSNYQVGPSICISGAKAREIEGFYTNGFEGYRPAISNSSPVITGTNGWWIFNGGQNDKVTSTAAQIFNCNTNLAQLARSQGWKVIVVGMGVGDHWTEDYNAQMSNYWRSGLIEGFVDLYNLIPSQPTHPDYAGHQVVASNIYAQILAFDSPSNRVIIGSESRVTLPASAEWSQMINFAPGDGETVYLNPPIFRWRYVPTPRESYGASSDTIPRRVFRFQCAHDATFLTPVVNIVTSNNFYNFLAPFTNTSVFWRVHYLEWLTLATNATSATRSFTVASTATNWDRSMLADTNYLASKSAHPHLSFTASNREEVLAWIQDNRTSAWEAIVSEADTAIGLSWFINGEIGNTAVADVADYVTDVAFCYGLTRATKYATNLAKAINSMATNYIARDWYAVDVVTQNPPAKYGRGMMAAYDWAYDLLDATQKSNVLYAIGQNADWVMTNYWWGSSETTLERGSAAMVGSSHPIISYGVVFAGALSAYWDSPKMRDFLEYGLNYSIARVYPYGSEEGLNQGRSYSADVFSTTAGILQMNIMAAITFPEAALHKTPFWVGIADWWMRMIPVNFSQWHEPWGDLGTGRQDILPMTDYRDLACFVGNGEAYRMWARSYENRSIGIPDEGVFQIASGFYYSSPDEAEASSAKLYPAGGWAIASSQPANAYDTFTNGVGFIFQARPMGAEMNHSHQGDGSFQLWAYGATLTDAGNGGGNYAKHSMLQYSLMVDGYGHAFPTRWPVEPYTSCFMAWTNNDDFTYVAADLTRAYSRSNWTEMGNGLGGLDAYYEDAYHTGVSSYVTNVQRHMLFPRKKYWVIFDKLQTTQDATFSWLYHVLEPGAIISSNDCAFTYTATNYYNGSNVTVHVRHIVNPASMTLTNMAGIYARDNPFTGLSLSNALDSTWRANAIWIQNAVPTTNWHFLSVVYPQKWGESAPTITRLDDYTVAVTNGAEGDIVSFYTNNVAANWTVDISASSAAETNGSNSSALRLNTLGVQRLNIGH